MRSRTQTVTGIVLKRTNVGEADKLITLLTYEQGKIVCRAKSLRKLNSRRSSHLELFNEVKVQLYQGSSLPLICEATTLTTFSNFRCHGQILALGFYICEVLDKLLPEREVHANIYSLLKNTLTELDRILDERNAESVVKNLVTKILWELGYLPRNNYPTLGITAFVESVAERKIASFRFLNALQ